MAATDCGPDPDSEAAVEYAIAHGVVVVSAAGNFDSTEPVYPASYPGVLSVAAGTDQALVDPSGGDAYLDFSEYGQAADIAAPGIDVLSTWNDGNYAVESGTSMAAPHVAAAAVLVIAADPALSGPQVTTILRQTASPLGAGSSPIDGGFLNAGAAVQAAASHDLPGTLDGYQLIGADGSVYNSGVTGALGSLAGHHLAKPVVGGAERSNGLGYWLVASDGGVFAFGDARFYGREATGKTAQTIVGIAPSPYGRGYWLAGAQGQVYGFGSAPYEAPSSTKAPAAPIVAISA